MASASGQTRVASGVWQAASGRREVGCVRSRRIRCYPTGGEARQKQAGEAEEWREAEAEAAEAEAEAGRPLQARCSSACTTAFTGRLAFTSSTE